MILLRSVGVPSRYVVGYLAHESDGPTTTVVRQRDAHAWAEAWIEGAGWVSIDATPGDGRPDALPPVSPWRRAWEKVQDNLTRIREEMTRLSRGQWAMILVTLVGAWIVTRLRLSRRPKYFEIDGNSYLTPDERLHAVALRFEKWMDKHDLQAPPSMSWTKYFEAQNSIDKRVDPLARCYERARWKRDEKDVQQAIELMQQLEEQTSHERTPK